MGLGDTFFFFVRCLRRNATSKPGIVLFSHYTFPAGRSFHPKILDFDLTLKLPGKTGESILCRKRNGNEPYI